ncbi:MAG: hypothetical protein JRN52_00870 [Nitrososphaerota archaeon]|nr:hypothetical protein [Nitrososphaerota archaeon]
MVGRRNALDIMADILAVLSRPATKSEIMAHANLSHDQCKKYLPALERLGLVTKQADVGSYKYAITEKGKEYHLSMDGGFGKIAKGDKSIWSTRRRHKENNEKS